MTTEQYMQHIFTGIKNFCYDKYQSLAFATIIPIIDSEYQTKLINKLILDSVYLDVTKNAINLLQYLVAESQIFDNDQKRSSDLSIYYPIGVEERITKENNDYAIMEVVRLGSDTINGFALPGQYIRRDRRMLSIVEEIIDSRRDEAMGYVVTSKLNCAIVYHKSQFWNCSNLDELTTFKLEVLYDKMHKLYHIDNLIIDNGYLSFIIERSDFDESYIDEIIRLATKAKIEKMH